MGPDRALLERMQAERGYVLSYHVIYGFLEPTFLDAYAALYRAGNLVPRFLSERQRELIWIALLAAMRQKAGMI
ncbi:MAG: hypothetical protein NZ518_08470, partial [Dehalococcoidia bacterium]|nr:hypothetical protein [Dehalococcoidia bacterium]